MQLFMIVGFFVVMAIMMPFAGTEPSPYRQRADAAVAVASSRLEEFAKAAWFAARTGATGAIDRSVMTLPAGFADDPSHPLQARVEGEFLYVWDPAGAPGTISPQVILPNGDVTVNVGVSTPNSLQFRNGQVAARPGWLPYNIIIVRLRV